MFSLDYKKYACLTALLPSSFYLNVTIQHRASLVAQMAKNPPAMWEIWVQSLGWEDPWGRAWQPSPVFLPEKSAWTEEPGGPQSICCKELDTTE